MPSLNDILAHEQKMTCGDIDDILNSVKESMERESKDLASKGRYRCKASSPAGEWMMPNGVCVNVGNDHDGILDHRVRARLPTGFAYWFGYTHVKAIRMRIYTDSCVGGIGYGFSVMKNVKMTKHQLLSIETVVHDIFNEYILHPRNRFRSAVIVDVVDDDMEMKTIATEEFSGNDASEIFDDVKKFLKKHGVF